MGTQMKKVLLALALVTSTAAFAQTAKTLACYKAVNPQDVRITAYEDVERDGRTFVEVKKTERVASLRMKLKSYSDSQYMNYGVLAKSKTMSFETEATAFKSKKAQVECDGGGWDFSTDAKTGNMTITSLAVRGIVTMTGSDEGCSDGLLIGDKPIRMIKISCSK
jgi:hypothetical protein